MNHPTIHKPPHNKHTTKQRLTEEQVRLLESSFDPNKKLEPDRKQHLSRQLGIPPRQIAIWYQNKRARWKNQSLEHDYAMLQFQLEATLLQTRHLQKEVQQLRAELNKVQAEQDKYYYRRCPMDSSFSVCATGDDVRSSSARSVDDDVDNLYCYGEQVFQVEDDMYAAAACMMGSPDLQLLGSKKNLF